MAHKDVTVSVIIPTYNAEKYIITQILSVLNQTLKVDEIIIIDSSSQDKTVDLATLFGAKVITIPKKEFNHGSTRTKAGKASKGSILVYMTQDAIPYNSKSIENLIQPLINNPFIGASYGRQIPYRISTPFSKHLRYFNYPDHSHVRELKDREKYGIKTCFISNSFAAYRRSALQEVGWFKSGIIMGEDVQVAAKLLIKGYKIAYVSESLVMHSHNYNIIEELRRYFKIGHFHKREKWIIDTFGKSIGEGKRYAISEIKFLAENGLYELVPVSIARNVLKLMAYKMGALKRDF